MFTDRSYDELAFPGGLDRTLKELKESRHVTSVELAVRRFLTSTQCSFEYWLHQGRAHRNASRERIFLRHKLGALGLAILLNVVDNLRLPRISADIASLRNAFQTDALVAELNVRAAGNNPDVSRRAVAGFLSAMGI